MRSRVTKLSWLGLVFLFLAAINAQAQSEKKKWPNEHNDCHGNCFSAEIVSVVPGEGGCTDYEMRVSHNGSCRYGLSHVTFEMPCGYVRNVRAPGGCGNSFGKDPTTGLKGLKIDGPNNFGKGLLKSFTVKFTWCNNSLCNNSDCWEPRIAFKAATCVDYDTARNSCKVPPIEAAVQKQNVRCAGGTDGSLSAVATGGVGPYTYTWSSGCDMQAIDNLPVGTYTVTITDSQGNEVVVTEEITAISQLALSASTTNPTCFGAANGSINLSVEGGVEPYSYLWSNGATTQDLSTLAGGSYKVTVSDSLGCLKEAVYQLTNPSISVTGQTVRPSCGQANGQIDITVAGGAEPHNYLWSNGSNSQDVAGLATGLYNVVVTDANACTSRTGFFLAENNTLKISFVVTPTSCVENSSGAINITVTGGTAPYSYLWMNGSTTEDLTGLSAGLQRVTVTDAGGCTAIAIINVFKQAFLVPSQVTSPTCSGAANGAISLNPNGVPPYTYAWSTGATTSSISNLSSGLYTVTVTDNTGCSQVLNYFIADPVINAFTTVTNPNCGAEGDFAINLSVNGGVAPYSYSWSNGATSEDISGLTSGTYHVTIADANGCAKSIDVVVQPVVINWSCTIAPPANNPVCGSSNNPLSTLVAGPAIYNWSVESDDDQWLISSGQTSPSIKYVAGGNGSSATFTLSITKDGCTQTCSYTVTGCSPVMSCGMDSVSNAPPVITQDPGGMEPKPEPVKPSAPGRLNSEFRLAAHPNPVIDKLSFDWTAEASEHVQLDLIDLYGKPVAELYSGEVREGEVYRVYWNASHLNDRLYFYRYLSGTRTVYGKLFKGD